MQALGLAFGPRDTFTVEATKAEKWDENIDHLVFSYNGEPLFIPKGHLSEWKSPNDGLTVERTGRANSVAISINGFAEICVQVVPVTEEDDRIHNYRIPSDDCYTHLEVQFRFSKLSKEVEGVIGRTYRPDFENPAKRGVMVPVVGGEDKYMTSSLVSSDCRACVFGSGGPEALESSQVDDESKLKYNK
ncbi:hypothetical protein QJS10_CPB21g00719 [Acorus calamus]|uniref:Uncharacterized protein n=1 Tax=Acorus calamus TaxID=4465 RepID=A0AAV9C5L8_ACOCL|nr:hypothetical protein QJS10_CPB21g00719 [Acorus calamus]